MLAAFRAVLSIVILVATVWLGAAGMAWAAPLRAAGLGVKLANLLTSFVSAEIYHQKLVMWNLSGGELPAADAATGALREGSQLLSSLGEELPGTPWAELESPIQTASQAASAALKLLPQLGQDEPPATYEELARDLGFLRKALDKLVLDAAAIAEKLGKGWEFQAAFIAQTVLDSPSPLYLQIPSQGREYLNRFPPDLPTAARQAMRTLLASANRSLSEGEEKAVRKAAEELIEILTGKPEGRP